MNNIAYLQEKIKSAYQGLKEGIEIKNDLFLVLLIIFTGLCSYGLGKLSVLEKRTEPMLQAKTDVKNESPLNTISTSTVKTTQAVKSDREVYASKNGTKYYYSDCSSLARIKEENKVQFASAALAEASGLTLASGCK